MVVANTMEDFQKELDSGKVRKLTSFYPSKYLHTLSVPYNQGLEIVKLVDKYCCGFYGSLHKQMKPVL